MNDLFVNSGIVILAIAALVAAFRGALWAYRVRPDGDIAHPDGTEQPLEDPRDARDRQVFQAVTSITRPRAVPFDCTQAAVILPSSITHDPRLHHTAGGTRKGHES